MKYLKQVTVLFLSSLFLYHCGNESPVQNNGGNNPEDTTFSSFIIISLGGTSVDTLYFTDRNLCTGSYSSSSNNTYCLLNDSASSQSISASFTGNTTGNPAFTFGFLSYAGGSFNGSGITGTVTIYESVGGKIKGTYTGTFSDGTISYQVNTFFTVIRTQ
jgi:hypothetical protein